MKEILYLNGKYMPLSKGKISVEDRGFQFGDGLYEVISVYAGQIFALDDHLARLQASAAGVRMKLPHTLPVLRNILRELVSRSGVYDGVLYLQLTRGACPRQHAIPRSGIRPTFLAYTRAMKTGSARQRGLKVITVPEIRWGKCIVKSVNLLPNILARDEATRRGADEAIFVRADGTVVEGAATNVFIVKNGVIYTAPEQEAMLSGVTRKRIIQLARKDRLKLVQAGFKVARMKKADEVFVSGTITELAPVIRVDGTKIGNGRLGPIVRRLQVLFDEMVREAILNSEL